MRGKIGWVLTHAAILQTHTGDYNNAGYPFHCQPIGGEEKPDLSILPDGSLASNDPELEVETLLPAARALHDMFPETSPAGDGSPCDSCSPPPLSLSLPFLDLCTISGALIAGAFDLRWRWHAKRLPCTKDLPFMPDCAQVVLKGGWRNEIAYRMIPELDMPIMRTWNETVPIYFLHHHYNDHCGDA